MKSMPESVAPYARTPEFTEQTIPEKLQQAHDTKQGVWGKIVVLEGRLRYRILEPEVRSMSCLPSGPASSNRKSPTKSPRSANCAFYVEFHR